MSKIKCWMTGAILGGLIGSALVLLFTPYSGEELKSNLRDYIKNIQDEVQLAGEEKRTELETQLEALRSGKA